MAMVRESIVFESEGYESDSYKMTKKPQIPKDAECDGIARERANEWLKISRELDQSVIHTLGETLSLWPYTCLQLEEFRFNLTST